MKPGNLWAALLLISKTSTATQNPGYCGDGADSGSSPLHLLFLFFGFFNPLTPLSARGPLLVPQCAPALPSGWVLYLFSLYSLWHWAGSSLTVETPSPESLLCKTPPTCRAFPNSVCHSWALTTLGLSTPHVKPRPLSTLRIRAGFHPQPVFFAAPSPCDSVPDPLEDWDKENLISSKSYLLARDIVNF